MSVELLNECKKKLTAAITKLDKTLLTFNSDPLEKILYQTCRAESIIHESNESILQVRSQLNRNSVKVRELTAKLRQNLKDA